MKIEVLYFDGCPNHLPAAERVRAVVERDNVAAEIVEVEVKDEAEAKALAFPGSPTIRVNGVDIEPAARGTAETGFACRRYAGGLPSEDLIRAAVGEALGR